MNKQLGGTESRSVSKPVPSVGISLNKAYRPFLQSLSMAKHAEDLGSVCN